MKGDPNFVLDIYGNSAAIRCLSCLQPFIFSALLNKKSGRVPDFKSSELSLLGDSGKAMNLLKTTVKAVSRLALSEPQLIADLKDC